MLPHKLDVQEPASLTYPFDVDEIPAGVSGVIVVELNLIAQNYQKIQAAVHQGKSAAVVKANAYGVGMVPVAKALCHVGCKDFFVATVDEGIELRKHLESVNIYVFNGVVPKTEALFTQHNLIPILNDLQQIDLWAKWSAGQGHKLPAVLHIDTGMWRMGLPPQEQAVLLQQPERLQAFDLHYIMSHLACSEQQHHPLNGRQLQLFQDVIKRLGKAKLSLANSGGILLGAGYHFDLVRPGKALLGVGTVVAPALGLKPALQVYGQILQVRDMPAGQSIGYDAQYKTKSPIRLATIGLGYADGIVRAFSNCGKVAIGGKIAPIVGRVSMDLITVDATGVPEAFLQPGQWAEVVGDHVSADEQAAAGGTISREIFTNFGDRNHRIYRGAS